MSGQRLLGERYEIIEEIGRGGMAEVVKAQDLRLSRRVAIKLLRPDLAVIPPSSPGSVGRRRPPPP